MLKEREEQAETPQCSSIVHQYQYCERARLYAYLKSVAWRTKTMTCSKGVLDGNSEDGMKGELVFCLGHLTSHTFPGVAQNRRFSSHCQFKYFTRQTSRIVCSIQVGAVLKNQVPQLFTVDANVICRVMQCSSLATTEGFQVNVSGLSTATPCSDPPLLHRLFS